MSDLIFIVSDLALNLKVELANGDKIYLKSFKSNQIDRFIDFVK